MAATNNNRRIELDVDQLAADYLNGATLEELGLRHGVSLDVVRSRLVAHGTRLRPPGRRPVLARTRARGVLSTTVHPRSETR